MSVRKRVWDFLEPGDDDTRAEHVVQGLLLALIFLNVVAVVAGSMAAVEQRWGPILYAFEVFSVVVFSIEYAARLWCCTADPRYSGAVLGRLRFMANPMSVVDLASFLPFYLPFFGPDLRSLRALRLLRLVRIAKVGRYYHSLTHLKHVLKSKTEELVLAVVLMGMLLVLSSSVLYYCENPVQPQAFSSIPAAMWWSISTLTTVGYGDIYPVTLLGKFFASIIATLGIGMFALPTAIIGAGFMEAMQKAKSAKRACPHCGRELDSQEPPTQR